MGETAVGIGGGGSGDLVSTNNLSDVTSAATSLANLGGAPITGEYPIPIWTTWGTSIGEAFLGVEPTAAPGIGIMRANGNPEQSSTVWGYCEFTVPCGYSNSTHSLAIRVRAYYTDATTTTNDIDLQVYRNGLGTDLCATPAQNLTGSLADYDFNITDNDGTYPLSAGSHISIFYKYIYDDTGGGGDGGICDLTRISAVVA